MPEDQEEKPKKMFVITHTVWDDGEIDSEMYEFRKNPSGRGAPGKWRLGHADFRRRVEELLGDFGTIVDDMNSNIGVGDFTDSNLKVKKVNESEKRSSDPDVNLDDMEGLE